METPQPSTTPHLKIFGIATPPNPQGSAPMYLIVIIDSNV